MSTPYPPRPPPTGPGDTPTTPENQRFLRRRCSFVPSQTSQWSPPGRWRSWLDTATPPLRASRSGSTRRARSGDFHTATTGDLYLATTGDVSMATDMSDNLTANRTARRRTFPSRREDDDPERQKARQLHRPVNHLRPGMRVSASGGARPAFGVRCVSWRRRAGRCGRGVRAGPPGGGCARRRRVRSANPPRGRGTAHRG